MKVNQMVYILYIGLAIMSMPLLASNDAAQPKSYNIEQFLNASERELLAHKRKLDDLEKQGKLNITPSQYPLFYPDPIENRKKMIHNIPAKYEDVRNWKPGNILFKPDQITALNKAIAKEEKIYARGGATAYHSLNPKLYAQAYIRTKTDSLIRELQGQPVTPSKFLLFRDWRSDYDAEKQKRKEYLSSGSSPGDTNREESANLMSCSVGLSSSEPAESATGIWLNKTNLLVNTPPSIQIPNQYAPELKNLDAKLEAETDALYNKLNTGILLQTEVKDKRMLNKIMYVSHPGGSKRNPKIKSQNNESITIDTPQDLIQTLTHNPSSFPREERFLNRYLQMRTVLTGDLMLDPTNPKVRENVAFNAYADNQEALDRFHTNVDTYFEKQKNRIKADYQMRYNKMNLPQKFWHNLQTRLCTPSSYAERRMLRKEGGNLFIRGNTFSGE